MVRFCSSLPRSTACTRAALAMFSSTISLTPNAASRRFRPSGVPTALSTAAARLVERELDRAAGEVAGIDAAQHDVGIGHGGLRAAAAVARRAGLGAGAFRPDIDARQRIDRGDRAAAGADLDHLDHRDAQRQAAALQEAVLPRHLEGARMLRLAVIDQADLGGRAAHVEATAPCRGRTAAPAPPPGWRRRPGPTRRGGSGTCAPSRAPPVRRPR